jgi:hypothetical protein
MCPISRSVVLVSFCITAAALYLSHSLSSVSFAAEANAPYMSVIERFDVFERGDGAVVKDRFNREYVIIKGVGVIEKR